MFYLQTSPGALCHNWNYPWCTMGTGRKHSFYLKVVGIKGGFLEEKTFEV